MQTNENFVLPNMQQEENPLIILGPAGEVFEFIRTGATTCGKYLISKAIVPPGAGPMPHFHYATDEWFYAPEGGITLYKGYASYPNPEQVPGEGAEKDTLYAIEMQPGDLVYVPRCQLHCFINSSDTEKQFYFVWTPDADEVSILNYFKDVGQVIKYPDNLPPISGSAKQRFVSEAPRYGIKQSETFWQYVKAVKPYEGKMESHSDVLLNMINESEGIL